MKIRLLKIFFVMFFGNNFSIIIEKISDLNNVDEFSWAKEVTENAEVKKKLVEFFEELTIKEFLEQTTGKTALFLFANTAQEDEEVLIALEKMLAKPATDFEKEMLRERIQEAAAIFLEEFKTFQSQEN